MSVFADISDLIAAAPIVFVLAFAIGFVVGARYSITKRNGEK